MSNTYIANAHPTCVGMNGCQFHRVENFDRTTAILVKQAQTIIETSTKMSAAIWCDQGNHAFSEHDPKREKFSKTLYDDDGDSRVVTIDMCGQHAAMFNRGITHHGRHGGTGLGMRTSPDDPAYALLLDDFTTTPTVYNPRCYICRDPEFAQMGLPLCYACPECGGHIPADDPICDDCGLDHYESTLQEE